MSQLLQVHRSINQGHLKPSSPTAGENSPNSQQQQHTTSMGSTSPQGMPIPARRQGGGVQENQHWIPGLLTTGNNFGGGGIGIGGWPHGINYGLETAMDSFNDISFNNDGTELDPMEGELSKLSMAVDGNDDEIFKVERNDILGPTLAELNAPDADTLLDGLNFDDLYWPADAQLPPLEATPSPQTPAGVLDPDGDLVPFHVVQSSSFPLNTLGGGHKLTLQPSNSSANSVPATHIKIEPNLHQSNEITFAVSPSSSTQQQQQQQPQQPSSSGGLRELLLRRELQNSLDSPEGSSPLGQSLPRSSLSPTSNNSFTHRLSTSAPTSQGNNAWEAWQQRREAVWSRRDPRPHLLSTGSLAEAGSTSSLSADVLSPGREFSLSMDEGFDSDELSDRDSSDEESEVSDTESNAGSTSGAARRERFFWQYNVQAKGPKGQRLVLAPTQEDPHVLHKPTDPVFSPLCHIQGIKHSGKARKGDGNDLTPNPRKLWVIGKELDRLNKVIAEMTPVADLPNAVKSRSRKEKNKLASRACRLKKKAQHEANKLKLYGLEQEHKRLMSAIEQSKQLVFAKMDGSSNDPEPVSVKVERLSKYGTKHKIGGHTTEFVNRVLEKVKSGVPDGGISEL